MPMLPKKHYPKKLDTKSHTQQRVDRERSEYDKCRGSAASRGYDADWQKVRSLVLRQQPICRHCGERDSKHVDHIQTIAEAPDRRLDPSNLQGLCHSCHSRKTAKFDGAFGRKPKSLKDNSVGNTANLGS